MGAQKVLAHGTLFHRDGAVNRKQLFFVSIQHIKILAAVCFEPLLFGIGQDHNAVPTVNQLVNAHAQPFGHTLNHIQMGSLAFFQAGDVGTRKSALNNESAGCDVMPCAGVQNVFIQAHKIKHLTILLTNESESC